MKKQHESDELIKRVSKYVSGWNDGTGGIEVYLNTGKL